MSLMLTRSAIYQNPSGASSWEAATTGCFNECYRSQQVVDYITWLQAGITATYTAATLLLVVNNRTNTTKNSTIFNTEVTVVPPTNINSASTQTFSIVIPIGGIKSTRYM